MRPVFKPDFEADVCDPLPFCFYLFISDIQSFLHDPFLRRKGADLLKVPFEGSEAAAGIEGDLFYCQVVYVVFIQEVDNIYFLWLGKIEKDRVELPVDMKE